MVGARTRRAYRGAVSTGIVGVVLWGTIILIGFFLFVVAHAMRTVQREGTRRTIREPVLKGWDETTPPDAERPPRR